MKIKKKILITGGLGFIGQNLVKFFNSIKFDVTIIDNFSSINSSNCLFDKKKVKIHKIDISNNDKVKKFFKENKKYNYIIHTAAHFANQNSVDHPISDMKTNILGIINLLEATKKYNLKKFIYLSSSCVYPSSLKLSEEDIVKPIETPYAISKYSAELYAEFYSNFYGIPINIVRIFNTYGPGEKAHKYRNVIPNFIERALANKNLYITGTGKETRDFTYIDDAVKIIFNTLKSKKKISIINSCTGKKTEIGNLAKKIIKYTNSKSKIIVVNKARKWDKIKNRTGNIYNTLKIINKKYFTEIDVGLKKTIDWYRHINY